ncbi:hypothetical protein [Marinilactibacillus sp. Marseille-P9653]|uniref:hypothetical protein n=1 Tax=Marinilactibacillus sp. Marseille-P9653 TaxID=2866583 RepID=UPI001CE3B85B|nr:hypothetical protein [Marinilactibacillus sp. Marseille-P9653]
MEKFAVEKNQILHYFKETYLNRSHFAVHKQMPALQLRHFIKQAVRKQKLITIQLNPSAHDSSISECTGTASFSPYSSQIILNSHNSNTVHLINSDQIRHIRLAN